MDIIANKWRHQKLHLLENGSPVHKASFYLHDDRKKEERERGKTATKEFGAAEEVTTS
jgi:hypothetical protein